MELSFGNYLSVNVAVRISVISTLEYIVAEIHVEAAAKDNEVDKDHDKDEEFQAETPSTSDFFLNGGCKRQCYSCHKSDGK